jgi:thiol:disulfide interchange protein
MDFAMVSMLLTATLATILTPLASLPPAAQSYADAYRDAKAEHKPLLVVVGAEWCPACTNLKSNTIRSLAQQGELEEVSLAVVDQDSEPKLANQLKRGRMIPLVILFSQSPDGRWKRTHMTGFQRASTPRTVLSAARRGPAGQPASDAS